MPPIKGMFRVLEKAILRPTGGLPWDGVRAMCVCDNMMTIKGVLQHIMNFPGLVFLEVNDRFTSNKNGWADCALYVTSEDEKYRQFVGEIQIVHSKMLMVREDLKAHDVYDECRFGSELLLNWYKEKEAKEGKKEEEAKEGKKEDASNESWKVALPFAVDPNVTHLKDATDVPSELTQREESTRI